MNTEQAYINGFVKRAAEYGFDENQAVELLKQSDILGEPGYTGVDEAGRLTEGEGLMAHLKRNPSTYSGAVLGTLLPGLLYRNLTKKLVGRSAKNNNMANVAGAVVGALGGTAGALEGKRLDKEEKDEIETEALRAELLKAHGLRSEGYQADNLRGLGTIGANAGLGAGLAYLLNKVKLI